MNELTQDSNTPDLPTENPKGRRCLVHNTALSSTGECVLCRKRIARKTGLGGSALVLGIFGFIAIAGFTVFILLLNGQEAEEFEQRLSETQPTSGAKDKVVGNDKNREKAPKVWDKRLFHGQWTMTSCAGQFFTEIRPNGTATTHIKRKGTSSLEHVTSSTWTIRDDSFVWIHARGTSRTAKGAEDINRILNVTPNSFTLRESSGRKTTMHRVETLNGDSHED